MFIAGLDLGKSADLSALAVVERERLPQPVAKRRYRYSLRWLQSWDLGTPYTRIVADVKSRFDTAALRRSPLAVDFTGVGNAVVDIIRAAKVPARLHPVLITAGHATTFDKDAGAWHTPKKELVSTLLVLLEAGLLKWAKPGDRDALPLVGRFVRELADFRVTVTKSKNEVFGAEPTKRDDTVLAVALAVWLGERVGGGSWGDVRVGSDSVLDTAPADAWGGVAGSLDFMPEAL